MKSTELGIQDVLQPFLLAVDCILILILILTPQVTPSSKRYLATPVLSFTLKTTASSKFVILPLYIWTPEALRNNKAGKFQASRSWPCLHVFGLSVISRKTSRYTNLPPGIDAVGVEWKCWQAMVEVPKPEFWRDKTCEREKITGPECRQETQNWCLCWQQNRQKHQIRFTQRQKRTRCWNAATNYFSFCASTNTYLGARTFGGKHQHKSRNCGQ